MTEKEYREHSGINYSLLAKVAISPVGLEDKSEDTSYFTMGSLVDCLCTAPDEYNDKYYVSTAAIPSDAMVAYCKELAESGDAVAAWEASGLKSDPAVPPKNGGDSKFEKEGKAYYQDVLQGKGKQVIDFDTNSKANFLANILKTNQFTSKFFDNESRNSLYNEYQYAIEWQYHGRICKSLLDIIHIDHERRTIRPVDLKTTGKSVFTFYRSYIDYKYYLQAAFYTAALEYALKHDENLAHCIGYEILPFQFIVIETNYKNPPHIFEVSTTDLIAGEYGGKILGRDYEIRGFQQLIDDLEEHRDTNQWEYKHEVYDNGGVILLESLETLMPAEQLGKELEIS
jgi:hypothetical protein